MSLTTRVFFSGVFDLDCVNQILRRGDLSTRGPHLESNEERPYTVPVNHIPGINFGNGNHRLIQSEMRVRFRSRSWTNKAFPKGINPREIVVRDI